MVGAQSGAGGRRPTVDVYPDGPLKVRAIPGPGGRVRAYKVTVAEPGIVGQGNAPGRRTGRGGVVR